MWFKNREIRLIISETRDPIINLLTEEVILEAVNKGYSLNTLRLWINDRCLVMGRGSKGYGWYNEELATKMNIKVYKRITGGGVVYHDNGNLNWSFYIEHQNKNIDIEELFKEPAQIIINALHSLNIDAYFMPPNRIEYRGYKISGMAAYVKKNAALIHGTLLVNANLEELNKLCIPPFNSPPVANLVQWEKDLTIHKIINVIENTLQHQGFNIIKTNLTSWEDKQIKEKYRMLLS
ncbi:MAG: lipoate--protein ligase family protein [Thermoprotei archaeon]